MDILRRNLRQSMTHSELAVLDATGHCPNLSAPEETIAAMRAYLASRTSPRFATL